VHPSQKWIYQEMVEPTLVEVIFLVLGHVDLRTAERTACQIRRAFNCQ
jgi:hypothetical protein